MKSNTRAEQKTLASSDSFWMTGETLVISGGLR